MTDPYALLLDEIATGVRLHYNRNADDADPDLALLKGDHHYAEGLARLAELGDLDAIGALADAISLIAEAQAAGDPLRAEAVWRAGVRAVRREGSGDGAARRS